MSSRVPYGRQADGMPQPNGKSLEYGGNVTAVRSGASQQFKKQNRRPAWRRFFVTLPDAGAFLHAIRDRVVPEAIEALQRAVHLAEFILIDAANLFDRADVALIEAGDDLGNRLTRTERRSMRDR